MTFRKGAFTGFTLVFLFVGYCALSAQDEPVAMFKEANDLVKEGQYNEAIKVYKNIEENGFISEDLFANMGNAFLNDNQIGPAILYYEKALLLNPGNKQAKQNLTLAKEQIINPVTHIPDFFLVTAWRNMVSQFGVQIWLGIHLFLLMLVLILAAIYWTHFSPELSARLRSHWSSIAIMIGLVVLSVICLLASLHRKDQLYGVNYGVVMEEGIPLQDGPDERSNEVTVLSEGLKARILDQIDNWYMVQLDDKDEGWVEKDKIELIKIKA